MPIHTSSDLTKKHTRFLLTGVRLSSAPITGCCAPSEIIEQEEVVDKQTITESNSYSSKAISQEEAGSCTGTATSNNSSSISNYLINMLPGWHVEEFFSSDGVTGSIPVNAPFTSISSNGFYQVSNWKQNNKKSHNFFLDKDENLNYSNLNIYKIFSFNF